jgi:hypothetical protein
VASRRLHRGVNAEVVDSDNFPRIRAIEQFHVLNPCVVHEKSLPGAGLALSYLEVVNALPHASLLLHLLPEVQCDG